MTPSNDKPLQRTPTPHVVLFVHTSSHASDATIMRVLKYNMYNKAENRGKGEQQQLVHNPGINLYTI